VETSHLQSRVKVFDPEASLEDKELLESVSVHGIVSPIFIRERSSGKRSNKLILSQTQGKRKFELVAGHRRVAAGIAAGLTGTQGILLNPGDDPGLITLAENQGRKELSTYEKAIALGNFQERQGYSGRQVAKVTGLSQTHVNRLLNALKAPEPLLDLWKEGHLSATALLNLKEHWDELSQPSNQKALGRIGSLSQNDTELLADQLSTGTSLAQSLEFITAINHAPRSTPSSTLTDQKDNPAVKTGQNPPNQKKSFESSEKEAVIQAIRLVFPRPRLEKINALFDLAIATNQKEVDIIFAAALYVSRGGDVNNAIPDCKSAMKNRSFRALMKREIKNMKQAAALYKTKKQKKSLKKTIRICFPGI
jgi:ParB/RepB/Spo0J family partition protein